MMKLDDKGYISIGKELPPFDVFVKVKGNDFRGDFYLSALVARKEYKQLKKGKNRGWRWVNNLGERAQFNDEIDGWKPVAHTDGDVF